MRWNRQTVKTVVIVFLSVAAAAFLLKFTSDHDGESITLGGDDPVSSAPVDPGSGAGPEVSQVESGDTDPDSGLRWILEDDLPVLAQGTLALIDQGGPFPYERDGVTFENREGLLPDHDRGYYHEYTVVAPGAGDRGPDRIVTGERGEYYWTEDHYGSFERIARRAS